MMLISAIIIVLTLLFDQITKYIASTNLPLNGANVTWIPGLFEVSYHQNPGMSFGALEGQQFLFMVATIIALGIFGYLFLSTDYKTKKVYSISIALFIAGTLGNAIDRALYGYVIDFMHFPFLDYILGNSNFYNNWADMYLSAAIVLFSIDLFIFDEKRKKALKKHEETVQS
ncbi:MAG TPA: signal peptidase II [Acholeplasmataceae bacterium]|nr:signal peptidase II [Acholeplasmataceae bacterium]HBO66867.1 signal peptidase II [Acholeplasmataceae bacterium]HBS01725.1 signal peptidase II [Acholeplasmataceae bacterium]HCB19947.1 signal peptidase II [Acholeplasmataceae bacterium]